MAAAAGVSSPKVWHCESNFIVCRNDHLLRLHESGYRGDLRRLAGHAFFWCKECDTYFFAHFVTTPMAMVTCYAIDRESYLEFDKGDETPTTTELLHRLKDPQGESHNPNWRPPR